MGRCSSHAHNHIAFPSWSLPEGPGACGSLLLSAVLPGTLPFPLLTGSVCISSSSSDSPSSFIESSALPCWSVSASDSSLSSVSSSPGRGASSLLRSSSSDLPISSAAGSGAFLFPLTGSLICNSTPCQSCLSLFGHEQTQTCSSEGQGQPFGWGRFADAGRFSDLCLSVC